MPFLTAPRVCVSSAVFDLFTNVSKRLDGSIFTHIKHSAVYIHGTRVIKQLYVYMYRFRSIIIKTLSLKLLNYHKFKKF